MKIKALAIIAVSTVLLLAGISVTGANPIAIHTAATNDVAVVPSGPRRPTPNPPACLLPHKSKLSAFNVASDKSTMLTPS